MGRWRLSMGAMLVACSGGDGFGETDTPALAESSSTTAGMSATSPEDSTGDDTNTPTSATSPTSVTASSTGPVETSGSSGDETGPIPDGCQNSVLDPGEQCDDGNDINADGCNRDCRESAQMIWSTTHGAGVGMVDDGFAVATNTDGSSVVAGYVSDAADARDGWIRKFDITGAEVWTFGLAGEGGGNDEIRGLSVDADGNIYAAGYESGPMGEGLNAWLRKYDADGTIDWTQTYNGPNSSTDVYDSVTIDGDQNIVAVGYHGHAVEGNDVFLRKYDPTGAVLWTREASGPNGGTDLLWDVAPSASGHLFVGGYEQGPAGELSNAFVAKYDTDGNEVWKRSFNGDESMNDYIVGVEVVGDDDVVVSGYSELAGIPWETTVRRYDSLGMLAWSDEFPGETAEGSHGFGAVSDSDGNIVVTGGEIVDGVRGVLLRKYDPDGAVLWSTVIPGGAEGPDYGRNVAIGENDEIHVSGAMDTGVDARDVWVGVFTP